MGTRGPVPKPSHQRRRRNKPAPGEPTATTVAAPKPNVKVPRVSPSWHPAMKEWYRSLKRSRQSAYYEDSDWQAAHLAATIMSIELNEDGPVKAATWAEFNRVSANLLTTEGERRRLRVELNKPETAEDEEVLDVMNSYRDLMVVPNPDRGTG